MEEYSVSYTEPDGNYQDRSYLASYNLKEQVPVNLDRSSKFLPRDSYSLYGGYNYDHLDDTGGNYFEMRRRQSANWQ